MVMSPTQKTFMDAIMAGHGSGYPCPEDPVAATAWNRTADSLERRGLIQVVYEPTTGNCWHYRAYGIHPSWLLDKRN